MEVLPTKKNKLAVIQSYPTAQSWYENAKSYEKYKLLVSIFKKIYKIVIRNYFIVKGKDITMKN